MAINIKKLMSAFKGAKRVKPAPAPIKELSGVDEYLSRLTSKGAPKHPTFNEVMGNGYDDIYDKLKRGGVKVTSGKQPNNLPPDLSIQYAMSGIPTSGLRTLKFPGDDPLNLPKYLLKPGPKGSATMDFVDKLSQQARAKYMGYPYNPDKINRYIDVEKVFGIKPSDLHPSIAPHAESPLTKYIKDNNTVNIPTRDAEFTVSGEDQGTLSKLLGFGMRSHAPNEHYAPFPGLLRGNTTIKPDVALHEINHFFASPSLFAGTDHYIGNSAVVPGFASGVKGQQKQLINKLGIPVKPSVSNPAPAGSTTVPKYPKRFRPDGYFNSVIENLTGIRTWKQVLGKHEVPSAGLHADLTEDLLPNGTMPFNKAMEATGYWKKNPDYNANGYINRITNKHEYQPRYIMGSSNSDNVPRPNHYIPLDNPDQVANLAASGFDLMNQINYMQYLIDLGAKRTPQQTKLLQRLQNSLPKVYEMASVAAGAGVPTAYAMYKANQDDKQPDSI